MNADILQGDVFDTLPTVKPGSVACVVTSPPYWMLRSYLPKDHPLKSLELGLEATPTEYVANMVRVFSLVRTALANHGTVWLNIGDTYTHSRGKRKPGDKHGPKQCTNSGSVSMPSATVDGVEKSNLCLIPQRLAIALQDDGWIIRSVVVWHKPAPMPCSVSGWSWRKCRVKVGKGNQEGSGKQASNRLSAGLNERYEAQRLGAFPDRPQSNHDGHNFAAHAQWADCPGCKKCEKNNGLVLRKGSWRPTSSWEPILMLAKTADYFCDGEAVKQPPAAKTIERDQYSRILDDPDEQYALRHDHETVFSSANPRDVWKQKLNECSKEELIDLLESFDDGDADDLQSWTAEPLKEKHYAAYPTALVEFCLRAGTSAHGYCSACGMPWVRVVEKDLPPTTSEEYIGKNGDMEPQDAARRMLLNTKRQRDAGRAHDNPFQGARSLGWRPSCRCPDAKPRPALALDPFAGSGRTAVAAKRLGLDFIGCELNPEYATMARRIVRDEMPLFIEDEKSAVANAEAALKTAARADRTLLDSLEAS